FQAEDGIRDRNVTGVQTCALPICDADVRVDHEHHHVGQGDRDLGLFGDAVGDALDPVLPATGVDQPEVATGPLGLVEHPVAGHPGGALDHGLAASQDAVDQGGLADVGTTDDGHH